VDALDMTESYSDLQVDSQQQYPKYPSLGVHNAGAKTWPENEYSDKIASNKQQHFEVTQQRQRKRICGVTLRTLWITAVVVVIVVIGAAIGGSLASINRRKTPAAATTNSQASTTTSDTPASSSSAALVTTSPSQTTSTISITTSTVIGPSETLLVDCPSSNNTLYAAPSTNQLYRIACGRTFQNQNSGQNVIYQTTSSLDGCISLCAAYNEQNATEILDGLSEICNAVCWRATIVGDDHPGSCFGFATTNSSGNFLYDEDSRCDGAAWVNQSV
jgi:hypothetical protein